MGTAIKMLQHQVLQHCVATLRKILQLSAIVHNPQLSAMSAIVAISAISHDFKILHPNQLEFDFSNVILLLNKQKNICIIIKYIKYHVQHFPIIIMSTVFISSFIMTMRNFPPFANILLLLSYSFYNFLFATRFVLLVQSFFDVMWVRITIPFFLY